MEEAFFERDGKRLAYLKSGVGKKRLIFLHGLCGAKEFWAPQIEYFEKTFEVLSIDLPGHGKSSPVSADRFLSESVQIVSEFLKYSIDHPTILLGHSLGGVILNEILDQVPSITSCVFVDSPCLYSLRKLSEYQDWEQEILRAEIPGEMIQEWFGSFLTEKCPVSWKEKVVGGAAQSSPQWIAGVMRNLLAPKMSAYSGPIFVVEGEQFYPQGNQLSWLSLYPQARGWKYPGQGHFYFLEDPQVFNQAVSGFIG